MKKTLRTFATLLAALVLGAGAAFAVDLAAPKGLQVPGGGSEAQPAGTVPWQLLQEAKTVQRSFPPHCPFCMPGGPESMVEVVADNPVEFTYEPIVVAGRMAVLDDDVVYYRLTNANAVPH